METKCPFLFLHLDSAEEKSISNESIKMHFHFVSIPGGLLTAMLPSGQRACENPRKTENNKIASIFHGFLNNFSIYFQISKDDEKREIPFTSSLVRSI